MRIVIQRVTEARVCIGGTVHSEIGRGLAVLVGVENGDTADDAKWLAAKTVALRIFDDEAGVMNRSASDTGNRPAYIRAAGHDVAIPLYELYCDECSRLLGRKVQQGVFGADMQVALVNDGPVTIIIDSRLRE